MFRVQVASLVATAAAIVLAQPSAATPPTHSNLAYGSDNFRQKLDLYIPGNEACGARPVVIFLYGGGWLVGEKEDVAPYVDSLLARGFVVASINYRFSYQAVFPAQIHDCKGAVRFLRGNAAKYNLDPNRIGVFGESAGAQLAALLGTSAGVASLEGAVGDYPDEPSNVHAVAEFSGPIDLIMHGTVWNSPTSTVSQLIGHWIQDVLNNYTNPDPPYPELVSLLLSGNAATHADASDAPCWLVHGLDDDQVTPNQAIQFDAALQAVGVPSTLNLLSGIGHGIPTPEFEPAFD